METIEKRLKYLISKAGLTVTEFALKTGNNPRNISNVVNGNNKPSFEVINNICNNLHKIKPLSDISIEWFITGREAVNQQLDLVNESNEKYNISKEGNALREEIARLKKQIKDKEEIIQLQKQLLREYKSKIDEAGLDEG
jgi:transcriptional regulator with XRE-family HTH domain